MVPRETGTLYQVQRVQREIGIISGDRYTVSGATGATGGRHHLRRQLLSQESRQDLCEGSRNLYIETSFPNLLSHNLSLTFPFFWIL